MDGQSIAIAAGAVSVIVAIIQMLKGAFPGLPSRFWPLIAVAAAVVWVSLSAVYQDEFTAITVLVGVVTGLAAGGAYSGAKALTGGEMRSR